MSCLNISGYSKLFSWLGYIPYVHYLPIKTPLENEWPISDDLADAIRYLKSAPEMQKNMAHSAKRHTLRNHTYLHRVKQVFHSLGLAAMEFKAEIAIAKVWKEENI